MIMIILFGWLLGYLWQSYEQDILHLYVLSGGQFMQ